MKFSLFKKFKKWTLPTKISVVGALATFFSIVLFSPFFSNDYSIYKYIIELLTTSNCKITFLDSDTKNKGDYDPDYSVSKIVTFGKKHIPDSTKLKLKQGKVCGTVNTEIQLPGQKRPYNLGDLDIDHYTIVLPLQMVFILNSVKDNIVVDQIAERLLEEDAILTWIDRKDLLPGDNWKIEIKEALEKADRLLFFFSNSSINEEMWMRNSLKLTLSKAEDNNSIKKLIIPILLDDISIPTELRDLVWLKMWEKGAYEKLVIAIKSD